VATRMFRRLEVLLLYEAASQTTQGLTMTDAKPSERPVDNNRMENARVGYQAAVNQLTNAQNLTWERINLVIVANSIFVGATVLALTGQRLSRILVPVLCVAGLILNVLWLHLFSRAYDYSVYLVKSARELEELYLSDPIRTLSRGAQFADGKTVQIEIGGKTEECQLSAFSSLARAKYTCWGVITVFGAFYFLMLVLSHPIRFWIHR